MTDDHDRPNFPDERFSALGLATWLLGQSRIYRRFPIACISVWIEPAIRHEQIHFFVDETGMVCGYMIWAWLAQDTEQRFLQDPHVTFHLSEWNEGERLWITDFMVLKGSVRERVREAFSLFPAVAQANSLRRCNDGTVRKVMTWRRKLACHT